MYKYSWITLISICSIIFLSSCHNAGSTDNQNSLSAVSTIKYKKTNYQNNGTDYGQLESWSYGASYSLAQMTQSAYASLCYNLESTSNACKYNLNNLQQFGGYSITQIANNDLNITNVIEYNIEYQTPGLVVGNPTEYIPKIVSGGVVIPQGITPNNYKGVILFYHGTVVGKNDYGPEADIKNGLELAAFFASQGYIVVFPDYLGYGVNAADVHPYVMYSQINAISGLNMLVAVRELLIELGIPNTPLNLYISGYSEGGSYGLWASRLLQNGTVNVNKANMTLTATATMHGPYDLSNAMMPFEFANVTNNFENNNYNILDPLIAAIGKVSVISFLYYSLSHYGGVKCDTQMYAEFCNLKAIGDGRNLSWLFGVDQPSDTLIESYLWTQVQSMPLPYSESNNSIVAFVMAPTSELFNTTAESADIISWKTNSPVALIHLHNDSVVTNINSINAYSGMQAMSAPGLVESIEINNDDFLAAIEVGGAMIPIDHPTAEQSYIATLSVFDGYAKVKMLHN